MLSLCLPPSAAVKAEYRSLFPEGHLDAKSKDGRLELLRRINAQLKSWRALMQRFLKCNDDQVRLLPGYAECGKAAMKYLNRQCAGPGCSRTADTGIFALPHLRNSCVCKRPLATRLHLHSFFAMAPGGAAAHL